jgi:phosphoenolpyruvate-protein kinase (PTS system EI component)
MSVSGEMSDQSLYTLLLLGLGLTLFSMNGPGYPGSEKNSAPRPGILQVSRRVMSFDSERQVMHLLRDERARSSQRLFEE